MHFTILFHDGQGTKSVLFYSKLHLGCCVVYDKAYKYTLGFCQSCLHTSNIFHCAQPWGDLRLSLPQPTIQWEIGGNLFLTVMSTRRGSHVGNRPSLS